jgi:hypothetical protein
MPATRGAADFGCDRKQNRCRQRRREFDAVIEDLDLRRDDTLMFRCFMRAGSHEVSQLRVSK